MVTENSLYYNENDGEREQDLYFRLAYWLDKSSRLLETSFSSASRVRLTFVSHEE